MNNTKLGKLFEPHNDSDLLVFKAYFVFFTQFTMYLFVFEALVIDSIIISSIQMKARSNRSSQKKLRQGSRQSQP
jgi:hypothetical protein